jgi:hypothetical protein
MRLLRALEAAKTYRAHRKLLEGFLKTILAEAKQIRTSELAKIAKAREEPKSIEKIHGQDEYAWTDKVYRE